MKSAYSVQPNRTEADYQAALKLVAAYFDNEPGLDSDVQASVNFKCPIQHNSSCRAMSLSSQGVRKSRGTKAISWFLYPAFLRGDRSNMHCFLNSLWAVRQ